MRSSFLIFYLINLEIIFNFLYLSYQVSCSMDDFMDDGWEGAYDQAQQIFQSRRTSYFDIDSDINSYADFMFDCQEKNNVDTADSDTLEIANSEQKCQQTSKDGLFRYSARDARKIEMDNKRNKKQYIQSKKGRKQETKELTINYKTLIGAIFEKKIVQEQLCQEEKEIVNLFQQSDNNISSFRKFFGVEQHIVQSEGHCQLHLFMSKKSDQIRKICLEALGSKQFISKILTSKKMRFENKLITIKYIQALRKGCILPEHLFSWKQL